MAELKKSDVLDYIRNSSSPQTKREIARAFKIKGGENRVALKQVLKSLEKDGAISKQAGGGYTVPDGLPSVGTVEVTDISVDGDIVAKIVDWDDDLLGQPPRIEIMPDKKHYPHMAEGKRALVRFERVSANAYEARIIKPLDTARGRVLGLVKYNKHGPILVPTDKKARNEYVIHRDDLNDAKEGDLAVGEVQPSKGLRLKKVRIVEVLGRQGDPKAISLISLHEAGLNEDWPAAVQKETKGMKVPDPKGREDLRNIPLVTIDGADARDFDDAVFAEKDGSIEGGGYHLLSPLQTLRTMCDMEALWMPKHRNAETPPTFPIALFRCYPRLYRTIYARSAPMSRVPAWPRTCGSIMRGTSKNTNSRVD